MPGPAGFVPYTQQEIDEALTAVIAHAGSCSGAIRYLKAEGKRAPAWQTLQNWCRVKHWERYEELREKFAQKAEDTLANNYLDAARYATEVQMLAVDKAKERLEKGKDEDPARTAANLSQVSARSTDKRLSLQGRPTTITETRDLGAILRSLAAKGVVHLPDEPEQIEAGSDAGPEC